MSDTSGIGFDREADTGPADEHISEAFALLGNETRLNILLAIWEKQVPLAEDNTVPFSRLFERVNCDDRGTFSYHLDQLEGQFITQHTERGGYELTIPGLKLVRTIIAGTGVSDATLEPTDIDQPCPLCDAPTEIAYREGVMFLTCTECEGVAPGKADIESVLLGNYFEPAGVNGRSPEELHAASVAASVRRARTLFNGLCPTCSGPVVGRLECCPNHEPTSDCANCGRIIGAWAHLECRICKHYAVPNPKWLALFHPAVVALYDDYGVSPRVHAADFQSARRVFGLVYDHELDIVSVNPPQVTVTAAIDGNEVHLTFDETASVVDVRR
ncbi:winged helix-turn-helix domain-containing protein [Natronomonas sp. EA1]|uniref:winged helix-turn-helix domain-containing protein n=1 Tax=Natronomonas sp. EA1 TaxID=3421655 RepID=UPI003EB7FDE1